MKSELKSKYGGLVEQVYLRPLVTYWFEAVRIYIMTNQIHRQVSAFSADQ